MGSARAKYIENLAADYTDLTDLGNKCIEGLVLPIGIALFKSGVDLTDSADFPGETGLEPAAFQQGGNGMVIDLTELLHLPAFLEDDVEVAQEGQFSAKEL